MVQTLSHLILSIQSYFVFHFFYSCGYWKANIIIIIIIIMILVKVHVYHISYNMFLTNIKAFKNIITGAGKINSLLLIIKHKLFNHILQNKFPFFRHCGIDPYIYHSQGLSTD